MGAITAEQLFGKEYKPGKLKQYTRANNVFFSLFFLFTADVEKIFT